MPWLCRSLANATLAPPCRGPNLPHNHSTYQLVFPISELLNSGLLSEGRGEGGEAITSVFRHVVRVKLERLVGDGGAGVARHDEYRETKT